jgi:L-asparaginase
MTDEREPIYVVTTGGTIDKTYFDALSEYQVGETIVAKLLATARVTCPYRVLGVLRKDSLDLTAEDRAQLRERIASIDAARFVITHGTDTMTETAKALTGLPGKTLVLTGALTPARFNDSDAVFNLGMAFATAQIAAPGVYITMNGQVFDALKVRKDREQQGFVRIAG